MVKVFALIPQRQDIPREEFHSHWIAPHGELACGIDTLQGYVQCHRIRPGIAGLAEADYEGIAEVWFVDVETAAAMGENPVYAEQVNPDEPNFIDIDRLAFVFTDEHVLREGEALGKETPVVKAQLLLKRPDGTTREDFDAALAAADGAADGGLPGGYADRPQRGPGGELRRRRAPGRRLHRGLVAQPRVLRSRLVRGRRDLPGRDLVVQRPRRLQRFPLRGDPPALAGRGLIRRSPAPGRVPGAEVEAR